ncbi:MAG: exodeoxyribonuclease 7 large subunit [Betaproteobacteria bacterium]
MPGRPRAHAGRDRDAAPAWADTMTAAVTVSELLREVRRSLATALPMLWVAGEVASLTRAASGHFYFTLKDARAQARCVMFRGRAQLLPFRMEIGQRIEALVAVSVYEPRGELQLEVDSLRLAGAGALFEAFMRLKAKLEREGLFDPERKRPIPAFPAAIGIVTSLAAAALRDVQAVLAQRCPWVPVIVYPAGVQGAEAPRQLTRALDQARAEARCAVLLLVRGGGGIEDLQAYNDEALARALAASPIPIVTGIGHETDLSIADLVADLRTTTPTAAALAVSSGYDAALERLPEYGRRLRAGMRQTLGRAYQALDLATAGLVRPAERLAAARERVRAHAARLGAAQAGLVLRMRLRCQAAGHSLATLRPDLSAHAAALAQLERRLVAASTRSVDDAHRKLDGLAHGLAQANPAMLLARGYAIVSTRAGDVVRDAAMVDDGDEIAIELARGALRARVSAHQPGAVPAPAEAAGRVRSAAQIGPTV